MKKILWITLIAFCAEACNETSSSNGKLVEQDAGHFLRSMDSLQNEQLLDVRTPEEFSSKRIANAINADWNGSFKDAVAGLKKDEPVMVYCLSGARSSEAAAWLIKNGFSSVYQLEGGIRSWESAGFPVQRGDAPVPANATISTFAYAKFIKENPIVLVDFSATWCGPCQKLAPKLEELSNEMKGKFVLFKSDVDRDAELADSMNIHAMPTLILYKNGINIWREEGNLDKSYIADKINAAQ